MVGLLVFTYVFFLFPGKKLDVNACSERLHKSQKGYVFIYYHYYIYVIHKYKLLCDSCIDALSLFHFNYCLFSGSNGNFIVLNISYNEI